MGLMGGWGQEEDSGTGSPKSQCVCACILKSGAGQNMQDPTCWYTFDLQY